MYRGKNPNIKREAPALIDKKNAISSSIITYPSYLRLEGKKLRINIPLSDGGLMAFYNAWMKIIEIPEARKILEKHKLLMENK